MKLGKEVRLLRVVVSALLAEGLSPLQRLALRKAGVSLRELQQWSATPGPVGVLVTLHTHDDDTEVLGVSDAVDSTDTYKRIVKTILERAATRPRREGAEIRRLIRCTQNAFIDMKGDRTVTLSRLLTRWYEMTDEVFEVVEVTLPE